MSGLALLLHHQGHDITGSDMRRSSRTERLERAGIRVYVGHRAAYVDGVDYVVYNTDVQPQNPERAAAVEKGLALFHRSDILAKVLDKTRAITISGTHGKTTTTTMVGSLLAHVGLDPTVLVGGEVAEFDGNVRIGEGPWTVAEADESDGTFLRYQPFVAVATNVEPEHLDHFQYSFEVLIKAFEQYLNAVPRDGLAVIGIDNPVLKEMAGRLQVPFSTYATGTTAADITADDLVATPEGTTASLLERGVHVGRLRLRVPGRHNVTNALAALTVARHLGIGWKAAIEALEAFQNANRRFQRVLEGPIRVVDDYAHHPTEIRAALEACRQVTTGRVVALFQPQRYSRTQSLWEEFKSAFQTADILFLTEIYSPPGEPAIDGVTGKALAQEVIAMQDGPVYFVAEMMDAVEPLRALLRPGDTFITMGAGPVYEVGTRLAELLRG